jgi:hypothetical protein
MAKDATKLKTKGARQRHSRRSAARIRFYAEACETRRLGRGEDSDVVSEKLCLEILNLVEVSKDWVANGQLDFPMQESWIRRNLWATYEIWDVDSAIRWLCRGQYLTAVECDVESWVRHGENLTAVESDVESPASRSWNPLMRVYSLTERGTEVLQDGRFSDKEWALLITGRW